MPHDVKGVSNIEALVKRKIYTNNMLDTLLAYIGHSCGYEYIADTLKDPNINTAAVKALDEAGSALCMEYGFSEKEMKDWNDMLLRYIAHPLVRDTCIRVGADPVRKAYRCCPSLHEAWDRSCKYSFRHRLRTGF